MALLAAYAPFLDPGGAIGWADALLPLISIKPRSLDRWMRRTPLYCAVTPDDDDGDDGDDPPAHPSSTLILTKATTQPHMNSHDTTQMAAFHWCRLSAVDVAALAGRGGTVRLVDEATAAGLLAAGVDDGRQDGGGKDDALACEGGVRFPPPLPPPRPPPGQVAGVGGGGGEAYVLMDEEEEEEGGATTADGGVSAASASSSSVHPLTLGADARPAAAAAAATTAPSSPPPPPTPTPPSYETLAACIGPLYGSNAWGLVSWFEHHLDAGIGHAYIYTVDESWDPGSNPVHAVLAHYAAAGVVTVVDWSPVGGASSRWAAGSWYFNQPALHNDCLNRVRGVHRHVVFMDTDEYIEAAGWKRRKGVTVEEEEEKVDGGGGGPTTPPPPPLDASTGALARAVSTWAASPAYEAMHAIGFPCRWWAMLGDPATRRQLTDRDGLATDPSDEPPPPAAGKAEAHPRPPWPPSLATHPPLAPTPCSEPLLDRLPYRSANYEPTRSKFIARPDAVLAVEAHYVLEGAGADAVFAPGAVHHNHYFIVRDGVAAHPTAPRPVVPGGNASAPGGGLTVPVPGMMEVLDPAWPARFVESGLKERVAEVAAVACGGL